VKSPQSDRCVDIDELRLDAALTLIGQTGTPPARDQMPTGAYVQSVLDALCQLSSHDVLTALPNRRSFAQAMDRELDRVARSGDVALLLMVDIDHFKLVNDTYGHLAGDEVLRQVALRLLDCVRPMDTVARYGGEEFAVVLPNCSYTYGEVVAERIRHSMEDNADFVVQRPVAVVDSQCGGRLCPSMGAVRSRHLGRAGRPPAVPCQTRRSQPRVHGRND
jgi:diguanylate cyclase